MALKILRHECHSVKSMHRGIWHRTRKDSRSADLLSPQQVDRAEEDLFCAAHRKQADRLETAKLRRRAEAWVQAECCGLEVRAPGALWPTAFIQRCPALTECHSTQAWNVAIEE